MDRTVCPLVGWQHLLVMDYLRRQPKSFHDIAGAQDVRFGSCVDGAHGSRDSFGFLLAVGCKSCVRPVCAAFMTAGPDVIRRSGPYHSLALKSA